jgi:hypothetical protein
VRLDSGYLLTLLREVASGLAEEQGPSAQVRLEVSDDCLAVVMEARERRLTHSVDEAVYHYEPDGSDAPRHATWLVQLFGEEAR